MPCGPGPPAGQVRGALDGMVRRSSSITVVAGSTWRVPVGVNPRRLNQVARPWADPLASFGPVPHADRRESARISALQTATPKNGTPRGRNNHHPGRHRDP